MFCMCWALFNVFVYFFLNASEAYEICVMCHFDCECPPPLLPPTNTYASYIVCGNDGIDVIFLYNNDN